MANQETEDATVVAHAAVALREAGLTVTGVSADYRSKASKPAPAGTHSSRRAELEPMRPAEGQTGVEVNLTLHIKADAAQATPFMQALQVPGGTELSIDEQVAEGASAAPGASDAHIIEVVMRSIDEGGPLAQAIAQKFEARNYPGPDTPDLCVAQ